MAHEMTSKDRMVSGRGMIPWHRHPNAKVLDGLMDSETARRESGLDWNTSLRPMVTFDGLAVPGHYAVVRDDTEDVFTVVTDSYHVAQNWHNFKLIDELVGTKKAVYDTAGSLKGGRVVYLTALVSEFEVVPGDVTKSFLYVVNSHDKSLEWEAGYCADRIVCANTLNRALASGKDGRRLKHRHTSNILNHINDAAEALGLFRKVEEETQQDYLHLAGLYPSPDEILDVLKQLFPSDEESDRSLNIAQKKRDKVLELYGSSPTCNLPGMEGTAWSLYNSLTEFDQYYSRPNQQVDTSVYNQMFGTSADFAETALQTCLVTIK